MDDNSSEATSKLLSSAAYRSVKYLRNDTNRGVAATRNRGAAAASAEWLWFLDDDDELAPESIAGVVSALTSKADVLMYVLELAHADGTREVPKQQLVPDGADLVELLSLKWRPISASQIVIRRSFFDSIGGFDESFASAEDIDLWMRIMICESCRFVALPDVLAVKNEHSADQLSHNLPVAFEGQRKILEKWLPILEQRLSKEEFNTWYYRRLLVLYHFHCGKPREPVVPLGARMSFSYAARWMSFAFRPNTGYTRVAFEKGAIALARACLGHSLFSKLRGANRRSERKVGEANKFPGR